MPKVDVLLIEDDPRIVHFVKRGLEAEGFQVEVAADGRAGIEKGRAGRYRAIVLDLLLPRVDGIAVCRELRAGEVKTPILMLTAKDALADKLDGFRAGADDYLTKPFAFEELLVRLEALMRRNTGGNAAARLIVGDLVLDRQSREATRAGRALPLTAREFDLLEFLMANAHRAVGRAEILEKVWGLRHDPGTNVADVYIGYLRRKIGDKGEGARIRTVRGFGYRLSP
jgi:DNA-binding response OmpR family regulator